MVGAEGETEAGEGFGPQGVQRHRDSRETDEQERSSERADTPKWSNMVCILACAPTVLGISLAWTVWTMPDAAKCHGQSAIS